MSATAANRIAAPPLSANAASLIMAGFCIYGVFFALMPGLARAFPFEWIFYGAQRPEFLADADIAGTVNFYAAVLGGVMAGWFATVAVLLRSGQRFVWDGALAGLAVWFVIDSAGSVMAGFWQNALINIGFGAVLALVLVLSRPRA